MLVLLNSVAIINSILLVRRFFEFRTLSDYFLASFVIFFAQIIFIELLLGSIGQLYVANVLLSFLIIFVILSLFFKRVQTDQLIKPDIEPFINSKLLLLAFSVFTAFFLIKTFLNLANPPYAADSVQYHLAFPATWIRNQNLNNPLCPFGAIFSPNQEIIENSGISYFPINAELFFLWLMLPLRNAFLADVGEIPFYLIGILAVYSILRKFDVEKKTSLLAAFLWVLIPNILKQIKTASQIDVICASLFLLVLNTLLLCKEKFNYRNALFFGVTVGIFIGTKITNILWMAALMPLVFYILCHTAKTKKIGLLRVLAMFSCIIFMIVLFGGFMYIKNFVFTGNPFFPTELAILGKTIFKGLSNPVTYKELYASGDTFDLWRIFFSEGLGVQLLALILPGMFLPVFFFGHLKKRIHFFTEYLLLFITPLLMLFLYHTFIGVYVMRYLFPLISLGMVSSVIFITNFKYGKIYFIFISFISIIASASELAHRQELIYSLLLSLLFFIALFFFRKNFFLIYNSPAFPKIIFAITMLAAIVLAYLNGRYNKEEFMRYTLNTSKKEMWQLDIGRSWKWLNENTGNGARIAYAGRQEFYPLFGTKLKNNVRYISVNEREPDPYNKPDGLLRAKKDYHTWRNNLKKNNIEYLFIALPFFENREVDDPSKFTIEDEWALVHPEEFELLYSNSLARIYKIKIKG